MFESFLFPPKNLILCSKTHWVLRIRLIENSNKLIRVKKNRNDLKFVCAGVKNVKEIIKFLKCSIITFLLIGIFVQQHIRI